MGETTSPKFSLPMGNLSPHLTRTHAKLHVDWESCFSTAHSLYSFPTLYNGEEHGPPKLPLPLGGSWLPPNTWFLGPTQVHNPNGISISLAVFAGLTLVTNRHTDHGTSVEMWPKMWNHTEKISWQTEALLDSLLLVQWNKQFSPSRKKIINSFWLSTTRT